MTISVLAWPKNRNRDENPYNFLVYRDIPNDVLIEEFNYRGFEVKYADILHVHWPDRLLDDKRRWRLMWRFRRFLRAIDRLQKKGGKLVWTVHNLRSREIRYPDLADQYLLEFIAKVDGFIFLSEASKALFTQQYDKSWVTSKVAVISHPHYRDIYQSASMGEARKALSVPDGDFVLGFFGKIRVNKGIDALVSGYEKALAKDVRLLIAGGPDKRGMSEILSRHLAESINTTAIIRYLEPAEVGSIICACNVLIFPYQDILNSGSAILALSLGRPIIAPNIGSFPELRDRVGRDWVYLYDRPLNSDKLKQAVAWARARSTDNNLPDLRFAEPRHVAEQTVAFYRELIAAK